MNKQVKDISSFKGKLSKTQVINSLIQKNLKGGTGKCPPPIWD